MRTTNTMSKKIRDCSLSLQLHVLCINKPLIIRDKNINHRNSSNGFQRIHFKTKFIL